MTGACGRWIELFAKALALAGGAMLAGLTVVAVISIGGRLVGRPILGDFELMQVGCAIAIAFFLPYTQVRRANIIVEFFTAHASSRSRDALDAFGALLLALVMAVLTWRTGAGAVAMHASKETSMLLGVPLWYAYALATPSLGLTALAALLTAYSRLKVR